MLKRIKKYLRRNQKGNLLFMTAASLSAILFCGTIVVDLGSLYAYKSELQNAADAAALAGAHAYADNEEEIDDHPKADQLAEEFIIANLGEDNPAKATYQAKDVSEKNAVYYRVKLEDEAPTYFMKYFFDEGPTISVDGIASIATVSDSGNPFKDLFIFKENFNPINCWNAEKISVTFDGKIAYTDGSGENPNNKSNYKYKSMQYSGHPEMEFFATRKGQQESSLASIQDYVNKSINSAIGAGTNECSYMPNGQIKTNTTSGNYWSRLDFEDIDLTEFGTKVENMMTKSTKKLSPEGQTYKINNSTITEQDQVVQIEASSQIPNMTIEVTDALSGSDPLYLYIDPAFTGEISSIKINVDMKRPIFFCVPGTGTNWMGKETGPVINEILMNNHTFRGIFYAPNSDINVINAAHTSFIGSLAARSFNQITGHDTSFVYNDFSGSSSSGSGSSKGGKVSPSSQISLIQADDISWD